MTTSQLRARIESAAPPTLQAVRACQWCATPLTAGETDCPVCGSSGVPEVDDVVTTELFSEDTALLADPEEWTHPAPVTSPADTGDRLVRAAMVLAGCALVFALLGAVIGPLFLSPALEAVTGVPVARANDVRPMGAILGLVTGLGIGATWGWIAGADR